MAGGKEDKNKETETLFLDSISSRVREKMAIGTFEVTSIISSAQKAPAGGVVNHAAALKSLCCHEDRIRRQKSHPVHEKSDPHCSKGKALEDRKINKWNKLSLSRD